jgi:hypothetical protein
MGREMTAIFAILQAKKGHCCCQSATVITYIHMYIHTSKKQIIRDWILPGVLGLSVSLKNIAVRLMP